MSTIVSDEVEVEEVNPDEERISEVARLNAKYPKYWYHGGVAPKHHKGAAWKGRKYY